MGGSIGWLDVREIGERLAEAYPKRDPLTVRFTELRGLVEKLPGFVGDPKHPVNEKILETIQVIWNEEYQEVEREED